MSDLLIRRRYIYKYKLKQLLSLRNGIAYSQHFLNGFVGAYIFCIDFIFWQIARINTLIFIFVLVFDIALMKLLVTAAHDSNYLNEAR